MEMFNCKYKIDTLNEENIKSLIYFFELSTGVFVYSLGVNPFNQPEEDYKKAMYRLLERLKINIVQDQLKSNTSP